jgi:hypothetical protein
VDAAFKSRFCAIKFTGIVYPKPLVAAAKDVGFFYKGDQNVSRIVDMYLQFDIGIDDPAQYQAALVAFNQYWPRSSELLWQALLASDDDKIFLKQINAKFKGTIRTVSPLPDKRGWTFDSPLQTTSGWVRGSSGLHEWTSAGLQYEVGGSRHDWTFDYQYPGPRNRQRTGNAIIQLGVRWGPPVQTLPKP